MESRKEENTWRIGKTRAAFKRNLFGFVVVNLFFWIVWLVNAGADYFKDMRGIPWPVWITLCWGIEIAFHYLRTYRKVNE